MEYYTVRDDKNDSREYRLRRYDSIVAFHALKDKKQDMKKKAPKNYYEESAESLLEDILARRDDSYEI